VTESGADKRVPGYLGRVLDAVGDPAGTCFQVTPGVLVTAAHVLADLGADHPGAVVSVDPLSGGAPGEATVARVEALTDLAVLTTSMPLGGCVVGLVATDGVALATPVVVTGVVAVADPGHTYRSLDASGTWAGSTTRDDQLPLGRLESGAVMKGMSGAPVRRQGDDRVVGVVSGRYNSADGWLRDTVWVARSEAVQALCVGVAIIEVAETAASGRVELILEVGESQVRLRGAGVDVAARHGGVNPGLAGAVDDVRRRRARGGPTRWEDDAGQDEIPADLGLGRAGQLLGASFLPRPVGDVLADALARAEAAHQEIRLGIDVSGPLARLPWEALPAPRGGRALALHPLVHVYRRMPGATVRAVPGPLRILVAIASPEGGGEVLDYERELRNVVTAVRAARAGEAHVRVVRFGTTAAIHSALEAEEAHVLHVSAHGGPGTLTLEDEEGQARSLDADTFVKEAIPAGAMPLLVCLAACYTNVATAADAPSFAARLLQRGASAVVATETSVTDRYATRLFARLYGRLAEAPRPDVIEALCDARRAVQVELDLTKEGPERRLAALDEWAVVTVAAPVPDAELFDPAVRAAVAPSTPSPRIGLVAGRGVGEFVGRRQEQRRWPGELTDPHRAGFVLHGIGGIGKTTLASELVALVQAREPGRLLAQVSGEIAVDTVLAEVTAVVRRHLMMSQITEGTAVRAMELANRQDLPWQDRFAMLREHVLGAVPLLVVLDNFEDNLAGEGPGPLADKDLAELLTGWVTDPGHSRLLFTCRYEFSLPRSAETALAFKALGPLSLAETTKLVWSLPALDRLEASEVETVWRMVGGHPRTLEYLDALLSGGQGRYPDITTRLDRSLTDKLGAPKAAAFLASERTLDAALAESAVLAADDVLLDELLASLVPDTERVLLGASVYREPVDLHALAFQVGEADDSAGSVPDRRGADERVLALLQEAGIDVDGPVDLVELPEPLRDQLAPHLAELTRRPTPPLRPPASLQASIVAAAATTLLGVTTADGDATLFVHRWTASELERRWADGGRSTELVGAHRQAADYWQWRVKVWPQDKNGDVHDLLEARHHLLAAGDVEEAGAVTEAACSQLDEWGAWDREAALVLDMLRRLPEDSGRRAAWIGQLGILAQHRGDYPEAKTRYQQSLAISERLGDQKGMAGVYHQLGILAQLQGDYAEAETRYQQSLAISERLGNHNGMAAGYHQLGILAQHRGDYAEAETRYQQSLAINKQLSDQNGIATSHGQLGILAQLRGDYAEAETRYQQSLAISERLGDQTSMATSYHQLGMLAQRRGDYAEAETRYQQSLAISERLGNQNGMAAGYHQLGILAQHRGDYAEAETRYQQSLAINERLGDQTSMATSYGQLGILARRRGDYSEAETRQEQSLAISERLGDQTSMATSYGQLGLLAQLRGDYAEAETRYQQSLAINERLGDQTSMATIYHQLGVLAAQLGSHSNAVDWYIKALSIRLSLGVPEALIDLQHLNTLRLDLGRGRFNQLLGILDQGNRANLHNLLDRLHSESILPPDDSSSIPSP
jgi:tetratricopeptide (TPR) repeat protein